ncbi:MAG: hypothetical protein ACM3NH_00780 [Candidatus Saccharibacteria bacterium]
MTGELAKVGRIYEMNGSSRPAIVHGDGPRVLVIAEEPRNLPYRLDAYFLELDSPAGRKLRIGSEEIAVSSSMIGAATGIASQREKLSGFSDHFHQTTGRQPFLE